MYGKYVELRLSRDVLVKVWVWCLPCTSPDILRMAALDKLKTTLEQADNVQGGLSA